MPITNTWKVVQIDAYPEYGGEAIVVFGVHWTLTGDDGAGYAGYACGSQNVSLDLSDGFTPFANLTEAQVLDWVHEAMGAGVVAAHEANVAQQIADQINPSVVSPPLPWSA